LVRWLFLLLAYLLGSIPFSFLYGKLFRGQDIRKLGSGNLGTTNAFRVFGKPIGFATLFSDTLKSGLLVFLMMNTDWFAPLDLFHPLVYGLASVLGHIFPVWFRFKGGKGVAASFGLLLVYNFWLALIAAMVFLLTEYFTRYVSVSSTVGAITLWLMVTVRHWFITPDGVLWLISGVLVGLILFRHRANYRRLKAGTENRVKLFDPIDRWLERKRG
jgi:glycerol-3-phosphate acyltransferase PlsY